MSARQEPLTLRSAKSAAREIPSHHVLGPAAGTTWSSYLPRWDSQPSIEVGSNQHVPQDGESSYSCLPTSAQGTSAQVRVGFQNPWPSWHKPTAVQVWQALEWGQDKDPAIVFATQHTTNDVSDDHHGLTRYSDELNEASDAILPVPIPSAALTREQVLKTAAQKLLKVQEPSFDLNGASLKATWLGHAGVLVQLPQSTEPIRILFDPIFSQRCSPTQLAGPVRSYAPPCSISALPPIDLVIISHNHYDHLDLDTVNQLWQMNRSRLRFIVPLGNKSWFVGKDGVGGNDLDIPDDRVTELDWWDEVMITGERAQRQEHLRVICTPAQHGSGRYGVDANCALWSSWFVEHTTAAKSTKIFFGGDTGCQFHETDFPPPPQLNNADGRDTSSDGMSNHTTPTFAQYPMCPAFDEIVERLGSPDFLMLPISVGATLSFLRSYVPLPDAYSPVPRLSAGLTSVNHMPPWDAVNVFDRMTKDNPHAVCLAIHWGTFISGPEEVLKTLGQLEWACRKHQVSFARSLNPTATSKTFIALDHGASISL